MIAAIIRILVAPNQSKDESELLEDAVAWLRARLPRNWELRTRIAERGNEAQPDGAIEIQGPNGTYSPLAVEARNRFGPRDVERLESGLVRALRQVARNVPVLIVAPWLSERTRDALAGQDLNYLDLTGNALVRLDNPGLYISSQGARRDPSPAGHKGVRVRGPKAARLLRLLIDVAPPYGVSEVAAASALTQGYVSRLLDTLDNEALVERSGRGRVESVEIRPLVHRWAEWYDVLAKNQARTFIAPQGASDAARQLGRQAGIGRVAVTGSFAATKLAPVAAPASLFAYCDDADRVAEALGLLPADEGANVALLLPFDEVVWDGMEETDGLCHVAPSQLAVDCLTGTGRMPAEGEALLDWMAEDESRWRRSSLAEWGAAVRAASA